ncbi:MAG: hypothetical protein ACP5NF_10235 [Thermoanaerobaculum sp.]
MRLSLGHSITGRWITRKGEPVAEGWVRFVPFGREPSGFPMRQPGVRTDGQGRFTLEGLPEEEGLLLAREAKGSVAVAVVKPPLAQEVSLVADLAGAVVVGGDVRCREAFVESRWGRLSSAALVSLGALGKVPAAGKGGVLFLPPGRYRFGCWDDEDKECCWTRPFSVFSGEVVTASP